MGRIKSATGPLKVQVIVQPAVPLVGVRLDADPPTLPEADSGLIRATAKRAFHVNLRDNAGVEIGTVANPVNITGGGGGGGGAVTQATTPWIIAGDVTVSGVPHVVVDTVPTTAVTGPLTDTQLRATPVPVSATFWQGTQPVSLTTAPTTPVTGTFWQGTQPVSGTFFQATQPVSAVALPLPANAAQETGGNLATLVAKDFATAAKQDTGNTTLATIDTDLADLRVVQGAINVAQRGPLVQGVVSDTPETYLINEIHPLSLTSEGRLRVSVVASDINRVWMNTFNDPWESTRNIWNMENMYV